MTLTEQEIEILISIVNHAAGRAHITLTERYPSTVMPAGLEEDGSFDTSFPLDGDLFDSMMSHEAVDSWKIAALARAKQGEPLNVGLVEYLKERGIEIQ